MPAALEAVDLAALLVEMLAWALLTITVVLLAKLVSVMHFKIDLYIVSFEPLGWLADALESYILAGAEDARQAVAGAMEETWKGFTWGIDQLLSVSHDIARLARAAIIYLWQHVIQPFVHSITDPIRSLAAKAEAEVAALTKTVARDFNLAKEWGTNEAARALNTSEAFTRTEVAAARRDLNAGITRIDSYIHNAEAAAEALPGTITADFGNLWDELRKYIRPQDLADLLSAGLLSGMLLRVLTQEMGMDNADCRGKTKGICSTDPLKWAHMLEGLLVMDGLLSFKELLALGREVFSAGEALVTGAAD